MNTLLRDLRYAARQLFKAPVFFLAAVGTLGIGIGATTAIFSTVNAALLRPLPFPHFEDLVSVRTRLTDGRVTTGLVAPVEIARLNDPNLSIVRAAGYLPQPFEATLVRDEGPAVHVVLTGVTEGFFDLLGLPMTIGPGFTHEHHVAIKGSAPFIVVLSHRAWTEMFGARPDIIGRPLRLAEDPDGATVVGVAARECDLPRGTDFWYSLRLAPQSVAHGLEGVVRVRPGTRVERLRAEMSPVMAALAREFPASELGREYVVDPLVSSMVGDLRSMLLIVLGATMLLLALASVNVTNLLLARGTVRSREVAVRAALGASRGQIVRQLLTESLVLAIAGTFAGLGVAYGAVRLLLVLGASKLPRLDTVPFDTRVFLFVVAVLMLTGLTMGLAPAWRLATADIRTLVNESGRSATGGRATSRLMGGLVVAEIALAITLVAGAGWLVQSFAKLRTIDPGFAPAGRLVFEVRPPRSFSDPAEALAWHGQVLERVPESPAFTPRVPRRRFRSGPIVTAQPSSR